MPCGIPNLFAFMQGKLTACTGGVGLAVEAVVRLAVAADKVWGNIAAAFGFLLPIAAAFR